MEADNVMPNGAPFSPFMEPEEQTIERKREKAHTLEGLKVLQDLVVRLEKRIDFYGSVDSIPEDVKTDPEQFLICHNANELTRNNLRAEKEYIVGLLEAALPKR